MITRICKNRMAGGLMLAGLLATMVAGLGTAPALAQASLPAPAQPAMAQAPFAMTYSGRIVVRADRIQDPRAGRHSAAEPAARGVHRGHAEAGNHRSLH